MIKAVNIEKSYNSEKVLKGISLEIEKGDFVSVMGKSGSGKSTFINIIGGFLSPDSGSVYWSGKDIAALDDKNRAKLRSTAMGFVFQSYMLIPTLSVRDNILLPATLGNGVDQSTLEYVAQLTSRLEIENMLSKYPSQLSGGQCQRAAIIRALSYKPKAVILDEPTGALDTHMETVVMELLKETNEALGTTIIQVTHSNKVASYGKRIITISDGELKL